MTLKKKNSAENAKLLITGGAGYIGSHTIHYLLEQGYKRNDIIVFDNLLCGHKEHIPQGVELIVGDLTDIDCIKSVFIDNKIDTVIHFANYAYVEESMKNPGKYFISNILGGVNLLESMLIGNCKKIVFSSSCASYGIPTVVPIPEDAVKRPINPYGETKLIFEKILDWYWKTYKICSVSLRYFNAAGASFGIGELHDPETHLIPKIINAAQGVSDSISVYGTDYPTKDGTCIRDYIHVVDLSSAHLKAMQYMDKGNLGCTSFNIGTGKGTSVKQIINLVKKIQPDFKVINKPRREGDPEVLIANPNMANKVLDWKSKIDIDKIIFDSWAWHKINNEKNK